MNNYYLTTAEPLRFAPPPQTRKSFNNYFEFSFVILLLLLHANEDKKLVILFTCIKYI